VKESSERMDIDAICLICLIGMSVGHKYGRV